MKQAWAPRVRTSFREAVSQLSSSWWKGADPGRQVRVTIDIKVPTHRSGEDVVVLFSEFVEGINGGYASAVYVEDD
jgi:hypothetical protein